MLGPVGALLAVFARRQVGQEACRPHLAVRVGIGASHRRALVLEDLDPAVALAQLGRLRAPGIDHLAQRRQRQLRERLRMVGREADHAAGAARAHALEQRVGSGRRVGRVGRQCGEVVLEYIAALVVGIAFAVDARVPGAQVAAGVVGRPRGAVDGLLLPLPGALGAVRRYQHPVAAERIVAAVRMVGRIEHDRALSGSDSRKTTIRARKWRPAARRSRPNPGQSRHRPGTACGRSACA